jgi:2,4-dienoyl-CoA reductase-like NADH-dependent reductase (Old Yellow Enzyme family)
VPGIFTQSQISGWKKVTEAIHAKGGSIFCQLWHVGRATTPSFLGGSSSVSASSIPLEGKAMDGTEYSDAPPKEMTIQDIEEVTQEFAAAAKRALEAGFDGVEIHG